jgi:hypothetical protein
LCRAFHAHRASIEKAAEQLLRGIGGTSVILRSGYLRFRDEARTGRARACGT